MRSLPGWPSGEVATFAEVPGAGGEIPLLSVPFFLEAPAWASYLRECYAELGVR